MKVKPNPVKENPWTWANGVLYRMCQEEPLHENCGVIAGKIWLIGRAYSAALERKAGAHFIDGENFLLARAAPMIKKSGIDRWLKTTSKIDRVTLQNVEAVLSVHKKCTDLFKEIAGSDRRSLASKYLHFHQPNAFFIFDSLANSKIRSFMPRQRFVVPNGCDVPYGGFVVRCLRYRDEVFELQVGRKSSPRELDQYLLGY